MRNWLFTRNQSSCLAVWAVIAAWSIIRMPSDSSALDVQLTFDDSTPYFDLNGVNRTYDIVPIMNAAATIWEDIIKDAHTLQVTYRWEDLTGANNTNGPAAEVNWTTTGNRAVSATIRFDTHLNPSLDAKRWFFDPTPFTNEEHNIGQELYRELSASQQSAWYSGNVPSVFESSFWGTALPTAPDDARFGNDLLSVALHELGHPLGIPGSSNGLADGDYDVQPSQVGGNVMAINGAPGDLSHLPNSHALVAGGIGDWRKLPSVTDILAAASTSVWTQIDLPRKDLLNVSGNDDWNTAGNWIGNRVPDAGDDAFLRDGNGVMYASLSGNAVARNLTLADGAWLRTNHHTLTIGSTVTIDGTPAGGFNARLIGQNGGFISADILRSENGGQIQVDAGATLRINLLEFGDLQVTGNLEFGHVADLIGGTVKFGGTSPNTSLSVDGVTTVGAQNGAWADVWVENGGIANTGTVVVGTTFSDGRIYVGSAGQWNINGQLIVGEDQEGAQGRVYVWYGGDMNVTGSATIRRGQATQGLLDLRAGGTFDVANYLNIPSGGEVRIESPTSAISAGVIDISGGRLDILDGTVSATTFMNRAGGTVNHESGTIIVQGGLFDPGTLGYSLSGAAPGDVPTLELRLGAHASFTDLVRVGEFGDGVIRVIGGNGTRFESSNPAMDIGFLGSGRLEIRNGGFVDHTGTWVFNLGVASGSNGEVLVQGVDSRLETNGLLIVGDHGSGKLTVADGGRVIAGVGGMWTAHFPDSQPSEVIVDGYQLYASTLQVQGDLFVSGDFVQGSGVSSTLTVSNGGIVDVAGEAKLWSNGTVRLDNGSIYARNLNIGGGRLEGDGAVVLSAAEAVYNAGSVAPGVASGLLTVTGDYVQAAAGSLEIEIGGVLSGIEYDRLTVSGNATLAGDLIVSLINGFMPTPTDSFTILQADNLAGNFSNAPFGQRLDLQSAGSFLISFDSLAQAVVLSGYQSVLRGDFDADGDYDCADVDALVAEIVAGLNSPSFDLSGDGLVNIADLHLWRDEAGEFNLGPGKSYLNGDATLDGIVDGQDFITWNGHKFSSNNGWCGADFNADGVTDGQDFIVWNSNKFTSSDGITAVPEPGASPLSIFVMLTLGGMAQSQRALAFRLTLQGTRAPSEFS